MAIAYGHDEVGGAGRSTMRTSNARRVDDGYEVTDIDGPPVSGGTASGVEAFLSAILIRPSRLAFWRMGKKNRFPLRPKTLYGAATLPVAKLYYRSISKVCDIKGLAESHDLWRAV
jgi:hypothetical protein